MQQSHSNSNCLSPAGLECAFLPGGLACQQRIVDNPAGFGTAPFRNVTQQCGTNILMLRCSLGLQANDLSALRPRVQGYKCTPVEFTGQQYTP